MACRADFMWVLALGMDGALWVGTRRLSWQGRSGKPVRQGRLRRTMWVRWRPARTALSGSEHTAVALATSSAPPTANHEIVDVIGNINIVTQPAQTIAVVAFDRSQLTQPARFHYVWRLSERGVFGYQPGPAVRTKAPVYTAQFKHDGTYRLSVVAIDSYGMWSKPRDIDFSVVMPKPDPMLDRFVSIFMWLASAGILYFIVIFPLILLYPRFSWARTASQQRRFHEISLLAQDRSWHALGARPFVPPIHKRRAIAATAVPEPYITQSLFAEKDKEAQALTLDGSSESFALFVRAQRRALLIARSGTGKSVFLRNLVRVAGTRFLNGERAPLPVLISICAPMY